LGAVEAEGEVEVGLEVEELELRPEDADDLARRAVDVQGLAAPASSRGRG
jgi:hypothetical protein